MPSGEMRAELGGWGCGGEREGGGLPRPVRSERAALSRDVPEEGGWHRLDAPEINAEE